MRMGVGGCECVRVCVGVILINANRFNSFFIQLLFELPIGSTGILHNEMVDGY